VRRTIEGLTTRDTVIDVMAAAPVRSGERPACGVVPVHDAG
jgi:hypothetical protein